MITAPIPVPAHRPGFEPLVRAALAHIDELLDPADTSRGLGAVLAVMRRDAHGLAAQARLALAARCVAQRLRQEATEQFQASIETIPVASAHAAPSLIERRLRRKLRELRISLELRLPGRLVRAEQGLQALAESAILSDCLRGYVLTRACRQHVLDAAWIGRLEALAPLLQPARSPLATLTATCADVGLGSQAQAPTGRCDDLQQPAMRLFQAFAGAAEALDATRARLAASRSSLDLQTLAALDAGTGLPDLASLAIGSTPVRSTQHHGRLCSLLEAALTSHAAHLVDQALQAHLTTRPHAIRPILDLMRAWTWAAPGAHLPRPWRPVSSAGLPERLRQAVEAYLDAC